MFGEKNKKAKVKILFKSGNSMLLEVDKLSVRKSPVDNHINELSWVAAVPDIMYISLGDIEAVFELEN